MKIKRTFDYSLIFSALFALTMVILAVIGGFNNFSSVPYWDMWLGTLNFVLKVKEGSLLELFSFHNEHRIILSNILFLIDYQFFGGLSWFLIIFNYFLVFVACYVFWLYIRSIFLERPRYKKTNLLTLFLFVSGFLFLWTQKENLTWAFQSQFFLAQLVPFVAFYCQAKSLATGSTKYFIISCALGVLSAGTMANGVLTLPIMFFYGLFSKQQNNKNLLLLSLSIIVPLAYFYGFSTPNGHGNLSKALSSDPVGLIYYSMMYLGSPFYFLFGASSFGKGLSLHLGFLLTFITIYFFYKLIFEAKKTYYKLALIFFIVYIGGTAFGTAGGRLVLGLDQAFAYRYTTPALMAWCALAILFMHENCFNVTKYKWIVNLFLAGLVLASLNYQVDALKLQSQEQSDKNLAALALSLNINDEAYIQRLFPDSKTALAVAKKAIDQEVSIFGHYPFKTLSSELGKIGQGGSIDQCIGALDNIDPVPNEPKYAKVDGWIFESTKKETPYLLKFINNEGRFVGFALTGTPRPDVKKAVDQDAELSGFRGYILKSATVTNNLNAVADHPNCKISFAVSPLIYDISSLNSKANIGFVSNHFILNNNGFTGSDFFKSNFPDRIIYGSIINSDADRGAIKLQVNKGEYLHYRSGPTKGRQYIKVGNYKAVLPEALEWVMLKPIDPDNADSFEVEFIDDGDSWGEWSAIAVMDN